MTNAERDAKLNDIHEIVIELRPMVKSHQTTLYDPATGLVYALRLITERQDTCPAKQAITDAHQEARATVSAARSSWVATGLSAIMCMIAIASVLVIPSCQQQQKTDLAPPPSKSRPAG